MGDRATANFGGASKEFAELEPVAAAAREVVRLRGERTALTEMLADPEMKAMAEEELEAVAAALPAAEHALAVGLLPKDVADERRSEEHQSEPQSLMRISYAGLCLKQNKQKT